MAQEHQKAFGFQSLPVPAALAPGALADTAEFESHATDSHKQHRISSTKPEGQRARGGGGGAVSLNAESRQGRPGGRSGSVGGHPTEPGAARRFLLGFVPHPHPGDIRAGPTGGDSDGRSSVS